MSLVCWSHRIVLNRKPISCSFFELTSFSDKKKMIQAAHHYLFFFIFCGKHDNIILNGDLLIPSAILSVIIWHFVQTNVEIRSMAWDSSDVLN